MTGLTTGSPAKQYFTRQETLNHVYYLRWSSTIFFSNITFFHYYLPLCNYSSRNKTNTINIVSIVALATQQALLRVFKSAPTQDKNK